MPDRFRAADVLDALRDPPRLRALADSGLMSPARDERLDRWVEVAAETLATPVSALVLVEDRRQLLKSTFGVSASVGVDGYLPLSHSFCQYVAADGGVLAVADAREHEVLRDNGSTRELGVVAYLGAPVRVGSHVIGSLCVLQTEHRAWSDAEIRLLTRLADGLGAEIDLRAASVRLERTTGIVEAHNRIHSMIAADEPVDVVLDEIVRSIESYDPALLGSITLLDRELGLLHPAAAPNLPGEWLALLDGAPVDPEAGSCAGVVHSGREVIAHDVRTDLRWRRHRSALAPLDLRHCWSFPITRGDGAVIGAFGVFGRRPRTPSTEHRAFLRDAARLAGIAIERRDTHAQLAHEATHDALTGLPNRAEMFARLGRALARSRRSSATVGVLFVDLDRLKIINDTLGHDVGDHVLAQVAQRLAGSVRPGDTVARCGGEEFLVIAEDVGAEEVQRIAERLHAALASPLTGGPADQELTATASIGMAVVRGDEVDAREAVRRADTAMYLAKEEGGNRSRLHQQVPAAPPSRRLAIESALRHAIGRGELSVVFQPVERLDDGTVVSVETLVRWTHPELGEVSPAEFVPIAEQTDLIHDIGAWVMRAACGSAGALWSGGRPLLIAVNVSARQLRQRGFSREVADILRATGVSARRLVIEITETALLGSDAETARTLRALCRLGVRTVLDDFGTGYSSLASLKRQEIVAIKIDRSFVDGLPGDRENREIVTALVGMAHGLGLDVVAEGIETAQQRDLLRALGCRFGQGYLLGRPAPASDAVGRR
jgi:diguanylate cyclase (GGDEF)-like protein